VRERLDPLIRKKSPLSVPVKKPKATWVEPVIDADIEYSSFTDDGLLRATGFKGLREDVELPKQRAAPAVSSLRRMGRRAQCASESYRVGQDHQGLTS
jgi:bifunctional non-homologous end joining protein LigD